ncbi:CBS domain-containing protein [Glycomyces niveus]|uniref:CBS domain-containing protein n=1 Tax=Glycomyces niveus TaxID=2820287 RepID=A0ABS3U9M3_9ACTN|nr:hypothetical protein [Glycomyces sp. NEAU-S30]MBO3735477.1 hypothetical protein [Glycomyces sp. NEAU-S30]
MIRRQVKRVSSLDNVVRNSGQSTPEVDLDPKKGPEWLLDLALERGPDRPVRLKVEHLIAFWQAGILSVPTILRILEELERRGLSVEPDLRGLGLSAVVEIRRAGQAASQDSTRIGYCIGDVPAARSGLNCVDWDQPVTAMFDEIARSRRDYVGVTDEDGRLMGCVGLIEVTSAMHASPETPAAQVVVRPQLDVDASEMLFNWTGAIIERGFVCVVDETGAVTGAVNCADVTAEHQRRMKPLSQIEEIEVRLRNLLPDEIDVTYRKGRREFTTRKRTDQLTFGDYVTLIRKGGIFRELGPSFPVARFGEAVDRVRVIRNAVFHHRPGRPNQDDESELEALLRTLEVFSGVLNRRRTDSSPNERRRRN